MRSKINHLPLSQQLKQRPMKAMYFIILLVGIVLSLGTESLNAASNIIGLMMSVYACDKLELFNQKYV